ncbi:hypothetical protein ActroDRAFT_0162 [Actinospica robiniae DSM 44927]|uniref:Uncharacterized protein n=2 Tax=Actinospica robiniae TaxID=304901 RepID=W9E522_9ACTN|nr:hypothetical protein ActroDRAFT_0162 [Actinospica robiniae DSM 44927]
MAGAFAASSEAHWRATGAYIDGECSREQLLEAVAAIRKIETRGERWGMVETPTLVSGVLALCLRFEETSVQRWHKTLRDLANDAQSVVAEKASQRALDDPKKAYAAARWEEARWQLQYIIATEPNLAAG